MTFMNIADGKAEVVTCKVKLKNYTQPLNIYKIQFPVIASDFFRRITFRILETNPDISFDDWTWGYGKPLMTQDKFETVNAGLKEIIDCDDTDIFVPSCQWFNYHEDEKDLEEIIQEIIQKTNFKNYIKLETT